MEGPFWGRLCTLQLDARAADAALCAGPVRQTAVAHLLGTDQSTPLRHDTASRRLARCRGRARRASRVPPRRDRHGGPHAGLGPRRRHRPHLAPAQPRRGGVQADISHWVQLAHCPTTAEALASRPGCQLSQAAVRRPWLLAVHALPSSPTSGRSLGSRCPATRSSCSTSARGTARARHARVPLASPENVAPRAIDWTAHGMWILTRHGACRCCTLRRRRDRRKTECYYSQCARLLRSRSPLDAAVRSAQCPPPAPTPQTKPRGRCPARAVRAGRGQHSALLKILAHTP